MLHNQPTSSLYEEVVRRSEGRLAHLGLLVVRTGHHTGRAPNDKFVVREPWSGERVWWGPFKQPLTPGRFEARRRRMLAYLQGKDLFVQDCFLCAEPEYRTPVRVITESAWRSLFARNLLLQAHPDELQAYEPPLTILHAPHFHAIPELDGTRSEAFIILNFDRRLVPIGGTAYKADVWLVNTGWTGGPYATGRRMPLAATRALVRAAINGSLRQAPARPHAGFGVLVPAARAGAPSALLDPRGTWMMEARTTSKLGAWRSSSARTSGSLRAR